MGKSSDSARYIEKRSDVKPSVLVACEYGGRVREAFKARGWNAWSCDVLPSDIPGNHFQGDVLKQLDRDWDLLIGFPPCTKLSSIGASHWSRWVDDGSQDRAIAFFMELAVWGTEHIPRVAIENPSGIMSTLWRKPDQYVQPWWFGDPWVKRTGLWLKGLPPLVAIKEVEPLGHWVDGGTMTKRGLVIMEGSIQGKGWINTAARSHARSLTFQGIANAMAEQWS